MTDVISPLLRVHVTNASNIDAFERGDFAAVLKSPQSQAILFSSDIESATAEQWLWRVRDRGSHLLLQQHHSESQGASGADSANWADVTLFALTYLNGFLQLNVTGPPLDWSPAETCLKDAVLPGATARKLLYATLISLCSVDGEAVYGKIPQIGLFALAMVLVNLDELPRDSVPVRWTRFRVNAWHQRMLKEPVSSLRDKIRQDVDFLSMALFKDKADYSTDVKVNFLLERASVDLLHGDDRKARETLKEASEWSGLKYILTGSLGKRTKFQTFNVSQLVVLAKSAGTSSSEASSVDKGKNVENIGQPSNGVKPENIYLNDDTLLESISFTQNSTSQDPKVVQDIPVELRDLDAGNQPALSPLDSIHLLSLASSITNTSPDNGLTREETLPYAVRVIEGGSTNWQIYSDALLVRSRIEGYRPRTVERGVLQMQALVDQVIVETTLGATATSQDTDSGESSSATTFLPRPKPSESASNTERLLYIHALASPPRWLLEAELAERWVGVGGLRTALEIYERLEMWAETALCWAALEDEKKARKIIYEQLYDDEDPKKEKARLPNDAPRLFCILGDIDDSVEMYGRSWEVSNHRYARAQRSLGKVFHKRRDLDKAEGAYSLSLKVNPQNSQAWFALGCIRLELKEWKGAAEAFSRVVQIAQDDAEAWSNLAAALLRLPPEEEGSTKQSGDDEDLSTAINPKDPQKNQKQALVAFKRAASLKRESYRIWQNILNVAATLSPPPYNDLIQAQTRVIELRGSTEGEGCLDAEILAGLLNHVIQSGGDAKGSTGAEQHGEEVADRRPGLEHMFIDLMNKKVIPLITHSTRLWQLVAKLNVYLGKPSSALEAYEKAWRATLNKPGWDDESGFVSTTSQGTSTEQETDAEALWQEVVEATVELADAYESLGDKEATEGLKGGSGEPVCRNWRQKARMAIRSVTGRRAKAGLEGTERLQERLEMLKGS